MFKAITKLFGLVCLASCAACCIEGVRGIFSLIKTEKEFSARCEAIHADIQTMLNEHPEWNWTNAQREELQSMGYNI